MALPPSAPAYARDFNAQTGQEVGVAPGITRITAPNASPFTFTGTNSFLIGETALFVLDPGPDSAPHLAALETAIAGRRVQAILLTHTHKDHSRLAAKLAARTGAPLWFAGRHRLSRRKRRLEIDPIARSCDWGLVPDRVLEDGERITAGGVTLEVLTTPGHCANHMALGVTGTPYIFSGDHVMGWNSTLVAVPDGSMADYLGSLDKIVASPFTHYLPAHGGPIADGRAFARALKVHREMRNGQILEALRSGPLTVSALTRRLYPGMTGRLAFAAHMTLTAHLEYLDGIGAIRFSNGPLRRVARRTGT